MEYFILYFLLLITVICYDIFGLTAKKKECYVSLVFFLIVLAGFRYRVGFDTLVYMEEFNHYKTFSDIDNLNYFFSFNGRMPGWVLLNVFSKSLCDSFVLLQLLCALFTNIVIARFIYKNTSYIFSSILLYYICLYVYLNFEVLRQAVSIAFFLLFFERFILKKKMIGIGYAVPAFLFHEASIILLLVILLRFININRFRVLLLFIVGVFLLFFSKQISLMFMTWAFSNASSNDKILFYLTDESSFSITYLVNLLINFIIPFLYVYINITKHVERKFFYIASLIYSYCYILGFIIPIFYRVGYFFLIFNLVLFIEMLFGIGLKFKQKYSLCLLFILVLSLMKTRVFFVRNPSSQKYNYIKYYPYYSVFDKKIVKERELEF